MTVSARISPVEELRVEARDGSTAMAAMRRPPGAGPFPAVVMLHGGLEPLPMDILKALALSGWTMNRFLAAGYVTLVPTRRSRPEDPQTPGALWDSLAVIDGVKKRPEVDPNSLAVYGSSGGADLALEAAGETDLVAVVAEEPATVLFTGILNRDTPKSGAAYTPLEVWPQDPRRFYTPEVQELTRRKIRRITVPIFISQGDQLLPGADQLKYINEILIPELKAAGKQIEEGVYAGQSHAFGFAVGAAPEPVAEDTAAAAARFFADIDAFFKRHLPTQPQAISLETG